MKNKTSIVFIVASAFFFILSSMLILFLFKLSTPLPDLSNENFKTKDEFIHLIYSKSHYGYKKYNIYPSITIAQAILESNWGKSKLTQDGKNLFGIKAGKNYKSKVDFVTNEFVNNKKIEVVQSFRSYDSYSKSVEDYTDLLGKAKRYEALKQCKDYKEQAIALYACGYSTDPNYPQKLISIIEKYELYKYDKK
ncbi:MAG: glycoside hydrolase family 73 protein [Tepidibacter sp.]|jgi:flagellum-specific peptidoglycan hydrolase FlgJ|uniref:glycoside hydrolase family 73 protein n=1 Tax=Tepidibacter sp. TaxID=2529387 RepID=UPI0025ECFB6D|nr:glycoside hydrolase family 73 protein [Tepidibacter sp.]MCT4509659.1 glycoside hydrolase family 73 protein [Tepidibacter sp.]